MTYYYPCKPNAIAPDSPYLDQLDSDTAWIAEKKRNGWRCLPMKDEGVVTLWTRHKTIIKDPFTEIRAILQAGMPPQTILDGEMILTRRVKGAPDKLYLFDIIVKEGELVTELPLSERRKLLEGIYEKLECDSILLADQVRIGKKNLYKQAIENYPLEEGIVMKRLDSKYIFGLSDCPQNPLWLKCKVPEKCWKVGA